MSTKINKAKTRFVSNQKNPKDSDRRKPSSVDPFMRMFKTCPEEYTAKINAVLQETYSSIEELGIPAFGASLSSESVDTQVASTIAHRFLNKFEEPDQSTEQTLKRECFEDWIKWETDHLQKENLYSNISCLPLLERKALYNAQSLLTNWCRGYRVYLKSVNIEIPPGESYVSMQGYVSIYQKLRKKQHWTVTWNCLDDACLLIYHNVSLKRCAKFWFSKDKDYQTSLYKRFKHDPEKGFAIFRQQLIDHVLIIVDGSRGSSVYKNKQKRRFINVEATFSVILQRLLADYIRSVVKRQGNDLAVGQLKHKKLIKNARYATIDFSNASDSVHYEAVFFMLNGCTKLRGKVFEWRSYATRLDGVWHIPQKVSSMGNGFTFELMTLLLLALARSLTPDAFVYGDDVIIDNDHAQSFIMLATCLGFRVNNKKTFTKSGLRESCGAFYSDGYGYITCYDIKWCLSPADAVVVINKIFNMIKDLIVKGSLCEKLKTIFMDTHTALLACTPTMLKGYPHYDSTVLNTHVWVENGVTRMHRNSKIARNYYQKNVDLISRATVALQYDNDFVVVCTPIFISEQATNQHLNKMSTCSTSFAAVLYAGKRTKDVVRNKGYWKYNLALSMANNTFISLASLKQHD